MGCVILYVEDDPADCHLVQNALYSAAPATVLVQKRSVADAVAYLDSAIDGDVGKPQPHLVLLEIKFPEESGLYVLEWMRGTEAYQDTPVVILSSSCDPLDHLLAMNLGVAGFLNKSKRLNKMRALTRSIVLLAESYAVTL